VRVDRAWVVFDTKISRWLAEDGTSWTNHFDLAKIHHTREEARWAAWLASGIFKQNEPSSPLQLQQIEAVWTVKVREPYIPQER